MRRGMKGQDMLTLSIACSCIAKFVLALDELFHCWCSEALHGNGHRLRSQVCRAHIV